MADANGNGKLYTLTEVSKRTKISMPTLQRYKKMFNERIPSSGDGRSQRYPEGAIEIFNQLKVENSKKRGRPRKNAAQGAGPAATRAPKASKSPAKAARAEETADPGMLSLKEIEDQTGISYPTLLRYLKTSLKRIPHKGSGRGRRFPQDAVAVFKTLKEESRRGRKAGSGKAAAPKAAAGDAPPKRKVGRPPKNPNAKAPEKARPAKAAAPAPPAAPKRRGRPPKNPALAAAPTGDAGLSAQVRELGKTIAALQKQVNRLEAEMQKPFKVMLKR
jgi:uncharacterized small protein (DUF1192 family)/predicted DNA-binding transcriptional regulator AlpA